MQTGLMCFEVIAKINQTDVDIRKILKEYAVGDNELPKEELIRIIKNSDFKAPMNIKSRGSRLHRLQFLIRELFCF